MRCYAFLENTDCLRIWPNSKYLATEMLLERAERTTNVSFQGGAKVEQVHGKPRRLLQGEHFW
jgi:hypothetical protein